MIQKQYEMEIFVHGKPIKEYLHQQKTYIEGRKGSNFSIKLRNNSSKRALFVPTVDGLSVLDGKNASFDSRGYIVNGHDSILIEGWRITDKEIAQFFFSSPNDAYSTKIQKGNNLGIIGLAVFLEKEKQKVIKEYISYPIYPVYPRYPNYPIYPVWSAPNYFCGTSNLISGTICNLNETHSINQNLGTGWGEKKQSEVVSVEFERQISPEATFEIFYNTREQLIKLGIDFNRRRVIISNPVAFPNEHSEYCKPPNK